MLALLATLATAGPGYTVETRLPQAAHAYGVDVGRFLLPEPGPRCAGKLTARDLRRGKASLAVLEISPTEVRLAGRVVQALHAGRFVESDLRGMLSPSLFDAATARVQAAEMARERCPQEIDPFSGDLLLAVDPSVPFQTVAQAMYSVSQADFSSFWFVVDERSPGAHPGFVYSADHDQVTSMLPAVGDAVMVPTGEQPVVGCAFVAISPSRRWSDVVSVLDQFSALGAQDNILSLAPDGSEATESAPGSAASTRFNLGRPLPVLVSRAPRIVSPETDIHPCEGRQALMGPVR